MTYVPGQISLIALLPICICYLNYCGAFDKYRIMEINYPRQEYYDSIPKIINKLKLEGWSLIDFQLTENDDDNLAKITLARTEIRKLIQSQNMKKGVHINFSDKSKYWTLIKLLDNCRIDKAHIYILNENDFYVLNSLGDYSNKPTQGKKLDYK